MIKASKKYQPESGFNFVYDEEDTLIKTNDPKLFQVVMEYLNEEEVEDED